MAIDRSVPEYVRLHRSDPIAVGRQGRLNMHAACGVVLTIQQLKSGFVDHHQLGESGVNESRRCVWPTLVIWQIVSCFEGQGARLMLPVRPN